MELTKNQKWGIGIGVVLVGGGITGLYFYNKNKPEQARTGEGAGAEAGTGATAGGAADNQAHAILELTKEDITTRPAIATIKEVMKVVDVNNINATDAEINHVALNLTAQIQPDNRQSLTEKEINISRLVLSGRGGGNTTAAGAGRGFNGIEFA